MAAAGRRVVAGDGAKIGEAGRFEGEFKVQKNAPYIQHRIDVWERLIKKHKEGLAKKEKKAIKIELPDGTLKDGKAWETTPLDIAMGISKGLADSVVVAKLIYKEKVESLSQVVNADMESDDEGDATDSSVLWDVTRPLEGSCRMELLKFDDPAGQDVFWHSSAHILGQAMERQYGCHLTIGPSLDNGFYYDGFFGNTKLGAPDFESLTKTMMDISKENQPFERCVLSKEEALELFSENPFKVQLITNKVPDGSLTSCYRCGPLVDLCRGPHLPTTAKAKAFAVTKNSAAFWLGDQKNDSLQRVYAISFPSEKHLKEWKKWTEEAAKRDHRNIGRAQELFMHHPTASPGSTFWFPMGARIYNTLIDFCRSEYRLRGYTEVVTPNMYNSSLFKTSGHYQNYADGMYSLDIEKEMWMLKPMNCPGHFLMFDSKVRSYKELPIRYMDFGTLHRNEASGALSGLTRVRRFQQDDGHIFASMSQVKDEVVSALKFLDFVYDVFGFKATFALSTRPKKALGSKELWDRAEEQLRNALNESGRAWSLNPGDGAFYGPKIDVRLYDVMKRKHQCGTIQLDFQMPIRFNLQFRSEGTEEKEGDDEKEEKEEFTGAVEKDKDGNVMWREGKLKNGFERPVVIHRAILGSVERMSAILIEHYNGKWPFWLSPRQVMIIPVGTQYNEYGNWIKQQLTLHGFWAEVDCSGKTLQKKVRESQLAQWNYVCVVGEKEQADLSVNVRQRDLEKPLGAFSMLDFVTKLKGEGMPCSQKLDTFTPFQGRMPEVPKAAAAAPAVASAAASGGAKKVIGRQNSLQQRKPQLADDVEDDVEHHLENHPYLKGFAPTKADAELFAQLSQTGFPETPNLRRWYEHIDSFTTTQRAEWVAAA
jgi:threonyl-tRNA synthetase